MVVNILLKYASQFRNDYEYADKFYSSLEFDALFAMVLNMLPNLTFLVNSLLNWSYCNDETVTKFNNDCDYAANFLQ